MNLKMVSILVFLIQLAVFNISNFVFAQSSDNESNEFEKGVALFESGEFEQASKTFNKWLEANQNDAEAYIYSARSYRRLNKFKESLEQFERAIELCDPCAQYHLYYGNTLFMFASRGSKLLAFSRAKKGKKEIERAIKLDPNNIPGRYSLTQFHLQAPGIAGGNKETAELLANEMKQIEPDNFLSITAQVQVLIAKNELSRAESEINNIISLCKTASDSNQVGNMYNLIGYRYLNNENYVKAIQCFKSYVSMSPKSANAHDSLGEAYFKSGDLNASIAEYEKALALNPKFKNSIKILEKVKDAKNNMK